MQSITFFKKLDLEQRTKCNPLTVALCLFAEIQINCLQYLLLVSPGLNIHNIEDHVCQQTPISKPRKVSREVCVSVLKEVCRPLEVRRPVEVCGQSFVSVLHFFDL